MKRSRFSERSYVSMASVLELSNWSKVLGTPETDVYGFIT
jgi:hypothetical protein